MRIKELLAWAASVCLVGAGVFWYSGTFSIHPSYAVASEVADQEIAALNKAAPKFPRKPLLSADVRVLLEPGHGSAVHLGGGYFVTASHVATGQKRRLKLQLRDNSIREAEVLWSNKTRDVALLKASSDGLESANLTCSVMDVGEPVSVVGSPMELGFVTSFGRVARTPQQSGMWDNVYVIDGTAGPGVSGGPVYNSKGDLIGLLVGGFLAPIGFGASITGYSSVVPSSTICELLARS